MTNGKNYRQVPKLNHQCWLRTNSE